MSKINNNSLIGETIITEAKIHRILLILPIILTCFFVLTEVITYFISFSYFFGMFLVLLFAPVLLIKRLLYFYTSALTITNKRVIVKSGFISRISLEYSINTIESIIVHQGILGRILDYGNLQISGTGTTQSGITCILSPHKIKNIIQNEINNNNTIIQSQNAENRTLTKV